jgi:hypothetical protein
MRNQALIHRVVVLAALKMAVMWMVVMWVALTVAALKVLAVRQTERALPAVAQPPERVPERQLERVLIPQPQQVRLSVPAPHLPGSADQRHRRGAPRPFPPPSGHAARRVLRRGP